MEASGRNVDYFACPMALDRLGLLAAARHVISFERDTTPPESLADWEAAARH